MTAKGSRTPRKAKAKENVQNVQTEADDLRPFIVGSKVVLGGTLRDGPQGEVVAVKEGDSRMVHFEGEEKACEVTIDMLRRLP